MGVPIDRTYPAANAVLRHKIEQKGCVISEYPPRSEGVGANGFLQRNRLIAALSSAPVSYTHLDVYKRQSQGRGRRQR